MASAAVQLPGGHSTTFEPLTATTSRGTTKHHVATRLNYFKDPGDGREPEPNIVGKPETYERPADSLDVTVNDVRGEVENYTLDRQGFQIYNTRRQEMMIHNQADEND